MELNPLLNANASVIAVTTSAVLLQTLLDTASGSANVFRPHLDAVDLFIEDGDVRILYDGNTPTASKGILLKRGGMYRLRRTPVSMMRLISATGSNVAVSVQIGRSEAQEPSSVGFVPYLLEQIAGEDIASDVLKVESRNSYANILTATTTVVKTGAGLLHLITFNKPVASEVWTIYDNTAGSGTKIGTITLPATLLNQGPMTAIFDVAFTTGLTIVSGSTTDGTVSFR